MPKFQKHIFVCENLRPEDNPKGSCARKGGAELRQALKDKLDAQGLKKTVRANAAGCLDHCAQGCTMVVYPEAVWYGHVTIADLDEIVSEHILNDRPVKRLQINEP